MKKLALLIITAFVLQVSSDAQIGIGTTAPSASSILDLTSSTQGFLAPRMTYAQLSAITNPATGLLVYQTNSTPGYYFNYGTPAAPDWRLLGLGVTTPIGSGVPNHLAIWNTSSTLTSHPDLYWDNTNRRLGIGTTTPTAKLHIAGTASENQFNITAYSAQTQDIMQILGSTGTKFVTINDSGKFIIGGTGVATGNNVFQLIPQGYMPSSCGSNSTFELDANDGNYSDINIRLSGNGIPSFFLTKSRGTLAAPSNLVTGDRVGIYGSRGFVNSLWKDLAYMMTTYRGSGTTQLADLSFWTANGSDPVQQMVINEAGNVGIGTSSFNATNAERLKIYAGTGTINAFYGYGSIDNYLQLNIKNTSATSAASSDITATADNGSDTLYTTGIGVKSSTYSTAAKNIYAANDGYLYTNGGNLAIGTGTAARVIKFHTSGTTAAYERMRIDASGIVGIGTTGPNTSSIVDISSSTAGFLLPRMTSAQKSGITSPATGLLIYQTDGTTGFYYYNGTWTYLGSIPYYAGTGLTMSSSTLSLDVPVAVSNGGTGATSFTAGRLLFGNGTSAISTSGNLMWTNSNSRLGIGTSASTPLTTLDVNGTAQIGVNGTSITEIISVAIPNITIGNANPDRTYNFTVTNAAVGSSVIVSPASAFPNGLIIAWARVSAANTVQIQLRSVAGNLSPPGNITYYIMVIR
jgi:hypothetical protein